MRNYVYEEWRPIKIYEGKKCWTERILKPRPHSDGYLQVNLCNNSIPQNYYIHRFAEAFPEICGEYFEGAEVNHKDENKLNNCVENLEWYTKKYNNNFGDKNLRMINNRKGMTKPKPVLQYDLKGNFIIEFPSINEVKRILGYDTGNICKCCKGKSKQAYNYIWKYKNNE